MNEFDNRRAFLAFAGAGVVLAACRKDEPAPPTVSEASTLARPATSSRAPSNDGETEEVSATEDLMREHGVIRRALVVYREAASRMRAKPGSVAADAIHKAARLMRTFGEDYHEKQLEETHIFPVLAKAGSALGAVTNTLIAQHQRGREITDYILTVTAQKAVGEPSAEPLARTLEAFARMYEEHTAIEDTIVFPAWKKVLSPVELDQMGDLFEEIEHKTFGEDGFEDAVKQVAAIEQSLGIGLGTMTAPPPPKA